jgi:catechol 2,3-dioxygenase-like lactoylglutathione lyase family enzyme
MSSSRRRSLVIAVALAAFAAPLLAGPPQPSLAQRLEGLLEKYEKGQLPKNDFLKQATRLLEPDEGAPDLQPVTLDHVTFRVPDMERASRFYQDVLGMPLLRTDPVHYLGVGNSFMAIEPFEKPGQATAFVDHFCLGLKNFDAARIVARLAEKGIAIVGPADPDTVRFVDPDGITVQLCSTDYARKQTGKQPSP